MLVLKEMDDIVLVTQSSGSGKIHLGGLSSSITINNTLTIGKFGQGELLVGVGSISYFNNGLTVRRLGALPTYTFVGKKPASNGSLTFLGPGKSYVGDTLRIGLGENDQTGGTAKSHYIPTPFVLYPKFLLLRCTLGPIGLLDLLS